MKGGNVKYFGIFALVLALVSALGPGLGINLTWIPWVALAVGLVAGFSLKFDIKTAIAVLVVVSFFGYLATLPVIGNMLNTFFDTLARFFGGLVITPAVMQIFTKKLKVKF